MRSTHNLKKSSSWFWRLLSKSADLSKPWGRFFSNFVRFSELYRAIFLDQVGQQTMHLWQISIFSRNLFFLKFGLSEKHTKFEKICLMVLTNQLIYLVNVKTIRQIFSNYVCFSKSPNFKRIFQKCWFLKILHFSLNSSEQRPLISNFTTMAIVKLCCHNFSQSAYIMIFFVSSISYRPTDLSLLK